MKARLLKNRGLPKIDESLFQQFDKNVAQVAEEIKKEQGNVVIDENKKKYLEDDDKDDKEDKEDKKEKENYEVPDIIKKFNSFKQPNDQFAYICDRYMHNIKTGQGDYHELEAKFGTRKYSNTITKGDYNNVIKKLLSLGFTSLNTKGTYSLKIQNEFLDLRTGEFKHSKDIDSFRTEILGFDTIQKYCSTNNIMEINETTPYNIQIMKKQNVKHGDYVIWSANYDNFNFRVSLKNERHIRRTSKDGSRLLNEWSKTKKTFRYINRVTFTHPSYNFVVDLSIVRSSSKDEKGNMKKTYNIEDSNVFNNNETYEIEVEAKNSSLSMLYNQHDGNKVMSDMQKVIKFVLCGLQESNYPIS